MGKITNYNQIAYKQQSIKYIEVSENNISISKLSVGVQTKGI